MVSGGMTCLKYLLFTFNLLFVVSGIALLTVGAVSQQAYSNYEDLIKDPLYATPLLLIVVGVVVVVVTFFGCCGAWKENHCMLITFAVLILAIFGLELAGGITGYIYKDNVRDYVETHLNQSMTEYKSNPKIHQSWDILQTDLQCCGVNGPSDWLKVVNEIPNSCCTQKSVNSTCTEQEASSVGCLDAVKEKVESNALVIGGVGIGIAFVQLVGVIFACCLAKSIRKEYETV